MKNRTNTDWSKHILTENHSDNCKIWSFERPNTVWEAVHFINAKGALAVTGDFGNWIFNREFHPSADGKVSDYYWCEKLKISSKQTYKKYDEEGTIEEIKDRILKGIWEAYGEEKPERLNEYFENLGECGYSFDATDYPDLDKRLCKELVWLEECIDHASEGEERYLIFAHDNMPSSCDHDDVIICRKIHHQLLVVFDAFEQICQKIKGGGE